jgi:antitoxin Phd_YefM of type II toxin-antitoxin system
MPARRRRRPRKVLFITDRGKPAHVLLSIEDYRRLAGGQRKIADALAMPGGEDIEFEPPRTEIKTRQADLS